MAQGSPTELDIEIKPDGAVKVSIKATHMDELRQAASVISEVLEKAAWASWLPKK